MFDLFLLRGRSIEAMLGIPSFETEEGQQFFTSGTESALYCGGTDKKNQIPPFQSEALKEGRELPKSAPENKFASFEFAPVFVTLGLIVFELVCFFLAGLLVN